MTYKTIRVAPETIALAKQISLMDKINFPSMKNAVDKAVILLKQKVEFDKLGSLPQNSDKKEWLKHTNIPPSNLDQIDLSPKKIEKITQQQIHDLTKKTIVPITSKITSKSSV